ncbi:unnamed protein product [Zymoseptoria tritici ST99CH_1E4]|uniref:Uncharacterized protein n=1 Tax=Zymoseptoria tritici ST99CH_1E4 TaxID=1276532 RepID=A0A2H1H9G7_ZYMTR|nr:unnamed protein product [Zymoseptoria tritici ST99CH_1E4]
MYPLDENCGSNERSVLSQGGASLGDAQKVRPWLQVVAASFRVALRWFHRSPFKHLHPETTPPAEPLVLLNLTCVFGRYIVLSVSRSAAGTVAWEDKARTGKVADAEEDARALADKEGEGEGEEDEAKKEDKELWGVRDAIRSRNPSV